MEKFLIDKVEELAFSRVELNESLWESGILDSISIIEFSTEIEDEFDIEIPFDDIVVENFETLERLITYIKRKQAEGNG
jgi:acyl carrier protein